MNVQTQLSQKGEGQQGRDANRPPQNSSEGEMCLQRRARTPPVGAGMEPSRWLEPRGPLSRQRDVRVSLPPALRS